MLIVFNEISVFANFTDGVDFYIAFMPLVFIHGK